MEFAKDDAFLTKDRKLAEMQQDPMVHRGIGDAVKEIVHRQTQALYKSMQEAHVYAIDDPRYMATKEAKRKARSDRMKATWAKQRGEV